MKQLITLFMALVAFAGTVHAQFVVNGMGVGGGNNDAASQSGGGGNTAMQVWIGLENQGYEPGGWNDGQPTDPDAFMLAITKYQMDNGLNPSGEPDASTAQALRNAMANRGDGTVKSASMAAEGSEEDPCLRQEAYETAGKASEVRRVSRIGGRLLRRFGVDNAVTDAAREAEQVSAEVGATAADVGSLAGDCNQ